MRASRRWALWLPLLLGSAWLVLGTEAPPADPAALSLPVRPARPSPASAGADAAPTRLLPRTELFAGAPDDATARPDPFSARSWQPAPAAAALSVPAPVAPALPFRFVGKQRDGDRWQVFLALGEQTLLAHEGQTLEGAWRVDRVQPPSMQLTYLPLGLAQSLPIGEPE